MEYLRKSIEQSLSTFEAKIKERTPARSGEASHSRAWEAATEDLRKELSSLREHVHQELDGMWSKVARSTPQPQPKATKPIKTKTVASPPGAARSEADPPGDASKACSPGGDEEAFIEDAWVRVVKKASRPNVRLERQVLQAQPREEQPSNNNNKKRRRRRWGKRSVTKELLLLLGSSANAQEPQTSWLMTRWWPGRQGGFSPSYRPANSIGDFDRLIRTAKSKTSCLTVVGLVPRKYRTREDYSRALGVNRRLESLCKTYSIRFIDPWTTFFRKDNLFHRDGTHFSSHGARVFAQLLNKRLFKPVASRFWGPGRAEPI